MNWKSLCVMIIVTLVYLLFGGVVFHFMERGGQKEKIIEIDGFTSDFLRKNPCVNTTELDLLLNVLMNTYNRDIFLIRNASAMGTEWDIPNSIFFAGTVISTIGYGHLAPKSAAGRQFLVIYAVWGIPLFVVTLMGLGEKLNRYTVKGLLLIATGQRHPKAARIVKGIVIFIVGLILFVFIPAIAFMYVEGWSYSISTYYAFVTLSTIGFGDYVAGINPDISYPFWYRAMRVVWMFLGLAWLSIVVGSKQETVQNAIEEKERKRQLLRRERERAKSRTEKDGYETDDEMTRPIQTGSSSLPDDLSSSLSGGRSLISPSDETRRLLSQSRAGAVEYGANSAGIKLVERPTQTTDEIVERTP